MENIADSRKLKTLLVGPDYISKEDFATSVSEAIKKKKDIEEVLIENGLIRDEQLGQLIAYNGKVRYINLRHEKIDENVMRLIPEQVARSLGVIAFGKDANGIQVGMKKPQDLNLINILSKRFNQNIEPFLVTKRDLQVTLKTYRSDLKTDIEMMINQIDEHDSGRENDKLIVIIIDKILEYAYLNHVSDIHIEPLDNSASVRVRIDGIMHNIARLPKNILENVIARIKILSKMRIDEHLSAQDGKFQFQSGEHKTDVRVSIARKPIEKVKLVLELT